MKRPPLTPADSRITRLVSPHGNSVNAANKTERATLKEKLTEIEREKAPADALEANCRSFIESWSDLGELLESATLEEQRVVLQHLVEVLELNCTDKKSKT